MKKVNKDGKFDEKDKYQYLNTNYLSYILQRCERNIFFSIFFEVLREFGICIKVRQGYEKPYANCQMMGVSE